MRPIAVFLLAMGGLFGQATVPFVGCKSDGQVGPIAAPTGTDPALPISAEAAQRLAYYAAEGVSVLAPRGWYCFRIYGSGGAHLFVSPLPISSKDLFAGDDRGFTGPAVVLAYRYGDTSGRFPVAGVISRVFPAHRDFAQRVQNEGILDNAPPFPSGPYPDDKLAYKGNETVEFETPPHAEGLGTHDSSLTENDAPIRGVAMLVGETPDLLLLSVRLPAEFADLTDTIIQQVERDAQKEVR